MIKRLLERISPRARVFVVVSALVFVLDQLTKFWAIGALTHAFTSSVGATLSLGEKISRFWTVAHPARAGLVTVLQDFWHFRYVENPGAAWGFLSRTDSSLRTPFFVVMSIVAMGFIITYFRKTLPEQRWLRFALALVFGGAIGNLIDRVRLGYVIDFIDWHWYDKATWPTFNIADSGISVGVAILVIDMIVHKPKKKPVKS